MGGKSDILGERCEVSASCAKLGRDHSDYCPAIEPFSRSFMKPPCHLRVLRTCFRLLGALQLAVLLVTFEPRAQAYVDPSSGFVFLQVAGSMFAGTIYYMRHRLKRIIGSQTIRNFSASGYTERRRREPPIGLQRPRSKFRFSFLWTGIFLCASSGLSHNGSRGHAIRDWLQRHRRRSPQRSSSGSYRYRQVGHRHAITFSLIMRRDSIGTKKKNLGHPSRL
jgi:hypothetical protein